MKRKLGLTFIILLLMVNTACDPAIRSACRRDDSKDYEAFIGKDFSVYFGMEQGEVIEALRGEGYNVVPDYIAMENQENNASAWIIMEIIGDQTVMVRLVFLDYLAENGEVTELGEVQKHFYVQDNALNEKERTFVKNFRDTLLTCYGEPQPSGDQPTDENLNGHMNWLDEEQNKEFMIYESDSHTYYPGDDGKVYIMRWEQWDRMAFDQVMFGGMEKE